jgi:hypothetical protein
MKRKTRPKLDIGHAESIDTPTYGEEKPIRDIGNGNLSRHRDRRRKDKKV